MVCIEELLIYRELPVCPVIHVLACLSVCLRKWPQDHFCAGLTGHLFLVSSLLNLQRRLSNIAILKKQDMKLTVFELAQPHGLLRKGCPTHKSELLVGRIQMPSLDT